MFAQWLKKKTISQHHPDSLQRTLTALDLTLMGIGAIIGAGVFILTGVAAATKAGPAVIFSYIIAGMAALFTALAYAELASSIGGAGSAYSYAYAGLGEFIAWIIGWNLLLEYVVTVSTVSIGWSSYINNLLITLHIYLPTAITRNVFEGGIINLPAILIILVIAGVLCLGIRQSARFNMVVVIIKLMTIALFIIVASMHIDSKNWQVFLPFGWTGVIQGASLVFFAYIGFDALSTTVEETINPMRNIPIGIITSLIICTLIYMIVSVLLTLIVPYSTLNVASPVSDALLRIGHPTVAGLIAAGALAGLTTVILVMFYGLSRISFAMARDGLIPNTFAVISPTTHTPVRIILLATLITAILAGTLPIDRAAELVNIGTLAAFAFVCGGVMLFRKAHPNLPRPFKLPFNPLIPLLGMFFCLYLMFNLPGITWWRFLIWTVIGIFIYLFYGQFHSVLRDKKIDDSV